MKNQTSPTNPKSQKEILPGTILQHKDGWKAMFYCYNGISQKHIVVRPEIRDHKGNHINFSKHTIPYPIEDFGGE